MTIEIAEDWFNNNLSGQESEYTLENGVFTKTIAEADLDFEFSTDTDRKLQCQSNGDIEMLYFKIWRNLSDFGVNI